MTQEIDAAREARLNMWSRARDVFNDLVELPAHERGQALAARCGDDDALRRFVEAMLATDEALPDTRDDVILRGVNQILGRLVLDVEPGRRFGAFAVVEEIGRGGMGVVYLAERRDGTVAQRVALKLVAHGHLDAEASARLARERRVLAALEHPHIARLIDAGEDPTGIPYFAMEYVKGRPITRYCDERGLPLADRLRLFRQVCAAVQYAHANLVVHCDLKAGNILVTDDGLPKLLDFGIATTLSTEAPVAANLFLSPQSAAPEQFLGQPASIATDVYALGALLCELTGGRLPFDADDPATLRDRVLNARPRLPSEAAPALRRQLRGDIDAIVAKALNKAPQDRYASVEQLDADVAAHLATRPVSIRSGERGYRAWTFVRRNVLPVSLAALLAVLAIGFGIVTLRQNERLAHERDQAEQREQQAQYERARAQQVTDFVVGLFKGAKPEETRGKDVSARDLLESGRKQLGGALAAQPQLKAAMLAAIAEASFSLDDIDGSEAAARESLALLDGLPAPPSRELAAALLVQARVDYARGMYAQALEHEARALPLAREMGVNYHVNLLTLKSKSLLGANKLDEAVQPLREALVVQEGATGRFGVETMLVASQLASTLGTLGFTDEALQILEDRLPRDRSSLAADDPTLANLFRSLAQVARNMGQYDRAASYAEESMAIHTKIFGEGSSQVASSKTTLATIISERGEQERALQLFKEALAIHRERTGAETPLAAKAEHNVGEMLIYMNRLQEALPYLQRSVAIGIKVLPANHNTIAHFRLSLGWALRAMRRYDEAEGVLRAALAVFETNKAPRGIKIAETRGELACIALKRGRDVQARQQLAESLQVLDKYDTANPEALSLHQCLADAK